MIPVKVQPKFKCDFCKRRSVKHVMLKHEMRCFKNPNRFCDFCQNIRYTQVYDVENGSTADFDCQYCEKYKEYLTSI